MPRKSSRTVSAAPSAVATLSPAQLALLGDPVREFLLGAVILRARTVIDLARELGCPATRLYHHMQRLERAGLVRIESTRLVAGIAERHYRAVAREFLLDRSVFGRGRRDRGLKELTRFVFDQSRNEIAAAVALGRLDLSASGDDPRAVVAYRASAWLTPAEAARFRKQAVRLHDTLFRLAQRKRPATSEPMSLCIALFPTPSLARASRARTPRTPRIARTRRGSR